jgi:hypothetical protein
MMEQTSPPMARIVAAKTTKTADQSALHRVPERLVSKRWDQQSDWVPCCGKWGTPPDNFAAPEEMSQPRRNYNVGCSSGAVRGKHVTSISDQTPLQCRQ